VENTEIQKVDTEMQKVTNSKVKGLRAEYGLSSADMAAIIGVSEQSYLARENGLRDFKVSEARKIKIRFKLDSVENIFFN